MKKSIKIRLVDSRIKHDFIQAMNIVKLLLLLFSISSCAYKNKNSKEDVEKHKKEFTHDAFIYQGEYSWSFQLMGSTQESIHAFFADSILYEMKGKIHSTDYPMKKLSYNSKQNKWIGESTDKKVYVLFFKNQTDSTLTIYKRLCKTNGLKEALQFTKPKDDATEDHGWNTYTLRGYKTKNLLPFLGTFSSKINTISISDTTIVFDNKQIEKMSYHSGERRWVGNYKNKYLQVFFQKVRDTDSLQLSISWYDDLELLYKVKYNSIKDWTNYEKQ